MMRRKQIMTLILACICFVMQLPQGISAAEKTTAELIQDENGNYLIGTAEELYLFSDLVTKKAQEEFVREKEGASVDREAVNAKLTADINLNPGLAFSYDNQTGKVTVSRGGQIYEMGTGLKNTVLGEYKNSDNKIVTADVVEKALGIKTWTPLAPIVTYKADETSDEIWSISSYVGYFDGNGHTIDGVYVYNPSDSKSPYAGFFGRTATSVNKNYYEDYKIKNLTIGENSLITSLCEDSYAGGVVGSLGYDSILNCTNKATVVANTSVSSNSLGGGVNGNLYGHAGGIVGLSCGNIKECKNYGTIISPQAAGGIVGNLMENGDYLKNIKVSLCNNYGNVYSDITLEHSRAGGIAANSGGYGYLRNVDGGHFAMCMNYGEVSGYYAGGIIEGASHLADISYCGNCGAIRGNKLAAGLVSRIRATDGAALKSNYNAETVEATNGKAYPIVGEVEKSSNKYVYHIISQCYNDAEKCPTVLLVEDGVSQSECYNVPTATFASGEAAYKMNLNSSEYIWKQNLELPKEEGKLSETYPTMDGTRNVCKTTLYCCHESDYYREEHKQTVYANSASDITNEHTPNEKGICQHCNYYVNPPVIKTNILKKAKVGEYYNANIYVNAHNQSTYETVKSEADDTPYTLPDELQLRDGWGGFCTISGIPKASGTYTFAVKVTNAFGTVKKNFTLMVENADELRFLTEQDMIIYAGGGYSCNLNVNLSGEPTWELIKSSLPDCFTFDEKTGYLSAENISEENVGTYKFTVAASLYGQTASKEFTVLILSGDGCKHENVKHHAAVAATCEKTGMAEYWSCDTCGCKWSDEEKNNNIWDFPSSVVTYANHKDDDGNNLCDYCGRTMSVFKKVTSEEDITEGGTYIFVSEIDGKYYTIKAPSVDESSKGGPSYEDTMPVSEITKNEDGFFDYASLTEKDSLMMKAGFCAEKCSDNGVSNGYTLGTIIGNRKYPVILPSYSPTFSLDEWDWGGAYIELKDGKPLIYSFDCKYANNKENSAVDGVLCAYSQNDGETDSKFMSLYPLSKYGENVTEHEIQLYKMVDLGETENNKKYVISDKKSTVVTAGFEAMVSNVTGFGCSHGEELLDAVKSDSMSDMVSENNKGGAEIGGAKLYTQISVTDAKSDGSDFGFTQLSYSTELRLSVRDDKNAIIADSSVPKNNLNGKPIKVVLSVGTMNPEQVILCNSDGSKEYFYDENSDKVRYDGKKSFSNLSGFVSLEVPPMSEIKILFDEEPEETAETFMVESVHSNNSKTTAKVVIPKEGTYTVIFADYDGEKLISLDCVTKTISTGETGTLDVESKNEIVLGSGDKVMIWNNTDSITPMGNAFVVK